MTNEQLIKVYSSEVSDLIYNFKSDAWKYLDYEQQRAINAFKKKILEKIKEEAK